MFHWNQGKILEGRPILKSPIERKNWLVDVSKIARNPAPLYEKRKQDTEILNQIDQVRAELAKLETQRIRSLIDEELAKTQAEEFDYFYGWSVEG